jgi:ribulose-phosphate 3-epimerase
MLTIIPAILTSQEQELEKLLSQVKGKADRVQIDIIDGVFAKNKTIDPQVLQKINPPIALDFQLMVDEPIDWLKKCLRLSNHQEDRIIGQIEMMDDQVEFVEKVEETEALPGLGVDLTTPIADLNKDLLARVEVVLLMSVRAGFGGQKFDSRVWPKIAKLAKIRKEGNLDFKICVDGGADRKVISALVDQGVDEVAIGRRIFKGDVEKNMASYQAEVS